MVEVATGGGGAKEQVRNGLCVWFVFHGYWAGESVCRHFVFHYGDKIWVKSAMSGIYKKEQRAMYGSSTISLLMSQAMCVCVQDIDRRGKLQHSCFPRNAWFGKFRFNNLFIVKNVNMLLLFCVWVVKVIPSTRNGLFPKQLR